MYSISEVPVITSLGALLHKKGGIVQLKTAVSIITYEVRHYRGPDDGFMVMKVRFKKHI